MHRVELSNKGVERYVKVSPIVSAKEWNELQIEAPAGNISVTKKRCPRVNHDSKFAPVSVQGDDYYISV